MLLLWLRILWFGVDLTTVIPCLGVSQLLIFVSCNVFKIVWLELLPTPLSIHTSLLLGRLSIGCLLNIVPFSRLPYWCTSSYIVVIQNILYLSLNLDIMSITHIKVKLMVCSLRSHTLPLQYKPTKHFGLSFVYDAPKIWNDLDDDVPSATSLHSFRKKLKTHLFASISTLVSPFPGLSLLRSPLLCLRLMIIVFLLFLFGAPRVCL